MPASRYFQAAVVGVLIFGTTWVCTAADSVVVVPLSSAKRIAELEERVEALEALLQGVVRNKSTIQFSGVNAQIVSGVGSTDGAVNGRGNLIVGYNELRGSGDVRTGSHNIIVGSHNNFSSYGGLVIGQSQESLPVLAVGREIQLTGGGPV